MVERLTKRDERGEVDVVVSDDRIETVIRSLKVTLERLAAYEDRGLEPEEIDSEFINGVLEENKRLKDELERFSVNQNDPLTLEELREMDGEPVWVEFQDGSGGLWGLVHIAVFDQVIFPNGTHCTIGENYYSKTWLAYRRKPDNQNDQNT